VINVDLAELATGTTAVSTGRWGLLDRMGTAAGVLKVLLACEGIQFCSRFNGTRTYLNIALKMEPVEEQGTVTVTVVVALAAEGKEASASL
jgi:hypothetical protein